MAAKFARLASQAYHTSSKALITTHSTTHSTTYSRICGRCCRQTALSSLSTKSYNGAMKRYFSKKGIDRSRFTHETKIEMPDIGDDTDCE